MNFKKFARDLALVTGLTGLIAIGTAFYSINSDEKKVRDTRPASMYQLPNDYSSGKSEIFDRKILPDSY